MSRCALDDVLVRTPHREQLAELLTRAGGAAQFEADDALAVTGLSLETISEVASMHHIHVRAEWIKLRSVRSTYLTIGMAIALGLGIGLLDVASIVHNWASMAAADRASFDPVGNAFSASSSASWPSAHSACLRSATSTAPA